MWPRVATLLLCSLWSASTNASFSVSGGLTRDLVLRPGDVEEGVIEILSSSDEPQRIRLYQTDYLFQSDGSNVYGPPGTTPRSNSEWITISPREADLPPLGRVQVVYRVEVPDDTTIRGSYWSMLMVEPLPGVEPLDTPDDQISVGVHMVVRHGVQFSVTIDGQGERSVKPHGGLQRIKDATVLQLDLDNTGDFMLRPIVWAEIYDGGGRLMGRLSSDAKRIYPGCSVRHSFDLGYPPGEYQALVVIDNGDGEVWGCRYNLDLIQ